MKTSLTRAAHALLFAAAALVSAGAQAQAWPSHPITLVVPFAAGSGTDQVARGVAQVIQAEFPGSSVVIDNRPGASGMIAAQAAARAAPDGYTLFLTTNTTQSANQFLFKKLPYDPVADFTPVGGLGRGAMVLALPSTSPIKTLPELIAASKKRPQNFGAGNSSSRVAGELFKQMTGAALTYVPYKSNPQAVTDLVGGQIDLMFADTATALGLVNSGKLKALAYTGAQRSPELPSIPTIDESGVKGYELTYWVAAYAPHGTPPELVRRLNDAIVKGLKTPTMENIFKQIVLDPFPTTVEGLAQFQRAETEKWGRVIKGAGIEPE